MLIKIIKYVLNELLFIKKIVHKCFKLKFYQNKTFFYQIKSGKGVALKNETYRATSI